MPDPLEPKKPVESRKLIQIAGLLLVFAVLAWAKDFLLPVVFAGLISVVLTPAVSWLERRRLHPVAAVMGVVAVAVLLIGILLATVSVQALDLVNSIPKYRSNINARWASIREGPPGPLNLAIRNVTELIDDLGKATATADRQKVQPAKVQVVTGGENILALARSSVTPLVSPLAEFAVVVLLVVFMLLERKRLRGRFLRLVGHSHTATTTLAVDEAGSRLSGFLLAQLKVNSAYALVLGIGLYFLGIPNAVLWAVLTLVLRFLPYVGIWISAFFPLTLAVATSTGWEVPLLAVGLYLVLEVFINNVIEPIVLGGSTGMSPLAVIAAALFWTWLWGAVGLVLATPLTACLVVLGRYFPTFHFFSVLLASEPPTAVEVELVRLLTENRLPEAKALLHEVTGTRLTLQAAEDIVVPTVRAIENELFPGAASNPAKGRIYQQMRELLEGLAPPQAMEGALPERVNSGVMIVPFVGEGDEIVGQVLAVLLRAEGVTASLLSGRMLRAEKLERLREAATTSIMLSCIETRSAPAVDKMARSLRTRFPNATILIGLWSLPPQGAARLIKRLEDSAISGVYTNLEQAVRGIVSLNAPVITEALPEAIPPEHVAEATSLPP
ncbi:MAG TPA: AI-2E family transporter [Chthoniobacterales bacterium]